jgi:hypothetical protein
MSFTANIGFECCPCRRRCVGSFAFGFSVKKSGGEPGFFACGGKGEIFNLRAFLR